MISSSRYSSLVAEPEPRLTASSSCLTSGWPYGLKSAKGGERSTAEGKPPPSPMPLLPLPPPAVRRVMGGEGCSGTNLDSAPPPVARLAPLPLPLPVEALLLEAEEAAAADFLSATWWWPNSVEDICGKGFNLTDTPVLRDFIHTRRIQVWLKRGGMVM